MKNSPYSRFEHFGIVVTLPRLVLLLAVMTISSVVGLRSTGTSSAATNHAPTGSFTSVTCAYDSGRGDYKFTIAAKWADSDTTASTGPANAYLGTSGAAANKPSSAIDGKNYDGPTHTWTFYRSTLTDGSWPIKLFVHDYGNANNAIWDLEAQANKPGCPAPPAPAPTPTPSPTPTPTPTPVRTAPRTPVSTPAAPTATASAAADGTVTAGTTTVAISVPAGSATTVHVTYTADPTLPLQATNDQPTNGATVVIPLTGLTAKTQYQYQLVRTLNGTVVTSPVATFTTTGYTISLIITNDGVPASGISGQLDKAKATSDKDGRLSFKDLDVGSYSIRFTYKGHTYSQTVSTDTATVSDDPTTTVVEQPVDLNHLQNSASSSSNADVKKSSAAPAVIIIIVILLVIGGVIWFILRRRRAAADSDYSPLPSSVPANPTVAAAGGDILDQQTLHHLSKHQPPAPEPLPEHAGKSLRELVVESMRAEAERRKDDNLPPPPHVPGGK